MIESTDYYNAYSQARATITTTTKSSPTVYKDLFIFTSTKQFVTHASTPAVHCKSCKKMFPNLHV